MEQGIRDKRIYFIINPLAGGGRAKTWWESFHSRLSDQGLDFFWQYTDSPTSAGPQSARAVSQGAEAVVVIGGDGTLYEVLNGLLHRDIFVKADLIFVPWSIGSACDFMRSLPKGSDDLLELLLHGVVKNIDIGKCCFRDVQGQETVSYFINSFDAGAGADTCVAVNSGGGRIKKLLKNGPLAFKYCALQVLMGFRYCQTVITVDEQQREGEFIILACGNGRYMGGKMLMFPQARLDSGQLEVLLVKKMPKLQMLRVFSRVYDGSLARIAGVEYLHGKHITISTSLPIAIELDGEVPGSTDAKLTALPGLLPLLQFPAGVD